METYSSPFRTSFPGGCAQDFSKVTSHTRIRVHWTPHICVFSLFSLQIGFYCRMHMTWFWRRRSHMAVFRFGFFGGISCLDARQLPSIAGRAAFGRTFLVVRYSLERRNEHVLILRH